MSGQRKSSLQSFLDILTLSSCTDDVEGESSEESYQARCLPHALKE